MIRQTLIPNANEVSLQLPEEFIGHEVEVIAFLKSEVKATIQKDKLEGIMASHASFAREWLNDAEEEAWKEYQ